MQTSKPRLFPHKLFVYLHVLMCCLVEQRVPRRALSPTSFLTRFSSDHDVVLCCLAEQRVPRRPLRLSSFLTSFSASDLHVVLCCLVEQSVPRRALSPTLFFRLITMW